MSFKINVENFEGPIDALLQMIEKRKMTISDISLAEIADDYIHFIQKLENESLSNMTHFIFVFMIMRQGLRRAICVVMRLRPTISIYLSMDA